MLKTRRQTRARARRNGNQPRAAHAGQPSQSLEQRLVEAHYLFARIVLDFGQAEFHGDHVIDAAAEIGCAQMQEALEEQARRDQQHNRKRDLHSSASSCAAAPARRYRPSFATNPEAPKAAPFRWTKLRAQGRPAMLLPLPGPT